MAPDNPKTGSSSGSAGGMIASEVHDAKRALDMASALNSKTWKAEDKDKKTGLDLEGATKAVDTVSKDDAVNLLLDGVNSLVDSLPPLVKALEAVAQIHPFVAIAVGAFKVVIELEIKRRDNDKKVNLLFLEMRNMMSVLLQLQSVRANHVARDGITIGARLVDLIKRTANDIKECANVCDTYSKKRLLIKVLKGPIWDDTLKGFIQLFVDHKAEFNFAVAIHTGMAIDRANDKLDTIMTRMESILKFFERCVPPSQRTLNTLVQQAGGPDAASQRPDVLQTLIERERSFEQIPNLVVGDNAPLYQIPVPTSSVMGIASSSRHRSHSGFDYSRSAETQRSRRRTRSHLGAESQRASGSKSYYMPTPYATALAAGYDSRRSPPLGGRGYADLAEFPGEQEIAILQQELMQAPSAEIKKNLEAFERKFEIQTRELAEEMKRFVVHEGDRVISSVLAGPHERILDPDLYEIWKDMRWRGIVKARHLVLAIHDYYLQKREDQEHTFQVDGTQHERRRSIDEDDAWTLEYIDLMHVQPIIEALDEDASGYVTIQEVNQFTTSRPKGWSLLHWMAYWAVGWQVSMTAYRRKILSTLDSMSTLLETVRPSNRFKIRRYLDLTCNLVANIVQSFQGDTERLFLLPRFRAYMNQNEARLQKGLEIMKYQIDALDTLALLNGRRGLERNIFPLLHLLLCRHYDIMKLGRTHVLHMDELIDAQEFINIVDDAFSLRRQELSELFDQRRLTVSQELRDFAYGMLFPSGYRPMLESNARSDNEDDTYKPNEERPSMSILRYPTHQEDFYPVNEDDVHDDEIGGDVDDSLKPILGRWSGVLHPVDGGFGTPLLNLHFHPAAANNNQVIASPKLYFSWMCTRAIVVGECNSAPSGDPMFAFTTTFNTASLQIEYLRMTLSQDGKTLVGYQDIVPDCSSPGRCSVVMKKDIPLELMAFYPSPKLLYANRPKALWLFATSAVLFQVQQRTITWARIKANRDKRRRFASLTYLHSLQSPLHPENLKELQRLTHRSTWAEIHYGTYVALEPQKFLWILPPCSGGVSGRTCGLLMKAAVPMLRCLSCPPENGYGLTAAFCVDNPNCLRDHLRTGGRHRIVKTRIHGWSMGEDADEVENKRLHIINTITDAVARLGGLRYDPPVAEPFSPHRLSTISEISEEEHGEPMSDAAVSSNVLDTLPVPPVHEEARHTFQDDGGSQADESTRQKKFGSHPVDAALSPHSDSPSDTTVVEGEVVSVNSLPDVTGNAIQPIVDSKCYCVGCNDEVKMPCWLCIDCPGSRPFVCLACDEKGGITAGDHRSTHTLTRIYEDREDRELYDDFSYEDDEMDDEDRDDSGWEASNKSHLESNTESQLIALGGRLTRMEDRFGAVESKLDRLEGMLETVLSLLRAPQPPIQTVECGVQSAGPP